MSPRTRVLAVVAVAAVAAVAAVVSVALLQTHGESTTQPGAVTAPRKGVPPLEFNFGVEDTATTRAIAHAAALYNAGHRAEAAPIFARYSSLEARIGSAFSQWPGHALDDMKELVSSHPRSAVAELHLGLALLWDGRDGDAVKAWTRANAVQPDSPAAVDAESWLHPGYAFGLPFIISGVSLPPSLAKLPAARQLAVLARNAAAPGAGATAKLLYGLALWNLDRPVSAERALNAAAALAPHDPLVQTAAAVAAFTKAKPAAAFARLGPLSGTFPKAAVVRLHLGLLLIWTRQAVKGEQQLKLAVADGPTTVYGKQAMAILAGLAKGGTR